MTFQKVMNKEELWEGEMCAVRIDDKSVLLIRLDDHIYAYENRCAHQCVALSDGELKGCTLICPAHQWEFDAKTGESLNPVGHRLKKYSVYSDDQQIRVNLEEKND